MQKEQATMCPEAAKMAIHLDDARCADLVLGLLEPGERAQALAHAQVCGVCETRLRAHVGASERAQADRLTLVETLPLRAARPHWGLITGGLAAAAAITLVFAMPMLRPHVPARAATALPVPGDEVLSRDSGVIDPHLAAGLAALRAHDMATARLELTAANTTGTAEIVRRLYLAQVLEASSDAEGALAQLRGVRFADLPEPWRTSGTQLFARVLRRTGHAATADSVEASLTGAQSGTSRLP
jgi:hypothetical protein